MDVRTEALRRACTLLGGPANARKYLGVSAVALSVWMAGDLRPPTEVFLKAVDVIVGEELKELRPQAGQDDRE